MLLALMLLINTYDLTMLCGGQHVSKSLVAADTSYTLSQAWSPVSWARSGGPAAASPAWRGAGLETGGADRWANGNQAGGSIESFWFLFCVCPVFAFLYILFFLLVFVLFFLFGLLYFNMYCMTV